MVSLSSPGWPKTHCASTSHMLGLNAYATMPGLHSQPSVTLTTFHVHNFIFSPTTRVRESLHLTAGSPGAQTGCYIPLVYLMVLLPSWSRQESELGTPQPQVCDLGTMLLHKGAVFCQQQQYSVRLCLTLSHGHCFHPVMALELQR